MWGSRFLMSVPRAVSFRSIMPTMAMSTIKPISR